MKKWIGYAFLLCLALSFLPARAAAAPSYEEARAAILQAARNGEDSVDLIAFQIPSGEAENLIIETLLSDPSLFYVDHNHIQYSRNIMTNYLWDVYFEYDSRFFPGDLASYTAAYQEAIDQAVSVVQPGMNDIERALALHDWLTDHCRYAYDDTVNSTTTYHSAYDALVNGVAVCDGYAQAYQAMLTRCGVPCVTVTSDSMEHAWNLVQIDGLWYHTDVTNDDQFDAPGQAFHELLLLSDSAMAAEDYSGWYPSYPCSSTRFDNWFWRDILSSIAVLPDGFCYYMEDGVLTRSVWDGSASSALDSLSATGLWPVWESPLQFYRGLSFSALAQQGSMIYFSDWNKVYAYNLTTDSVSVLTTYDQAQGQIMGLSFSPDGRRLRLSIQRDPDEGEVTQLWCELPLDDFRDVRYGMFYHEPIHWAVDQGITYGTAPGIFEPDSACTRAQTVTLLWRAAGAPSHSVAGSPFQDVAPGDWYYDAVLWALENGITSGTVPGRFEPDAICSRGQIVTFLWRAAGEPQVSTGLFRDVPVDAYYAQAVCWAIFNGITNGAGPDVFQPDAFCTRGQIVTFLYRSKN